MWCSKDTVANRLLVLYVTAESVIIILDSFNPAKFITGPVAVEEKSVPDRDTPADLEDQAQEG